MLSCSTILKKSLLNLLEREVSFFLSFLIQYIQLYFFLSDFTASAKIKVGTMMTLILEKKCSCHLYFAGWTHLHKNCWIIP